MYDTTDTIAAIATPLGESGIGVIRISGSHAYDVGDAISAALRESPWPSAGTVLSSMASSSPMTAVLSMKCSCSS